MSLIGATADLQQLGISPETLYLILADVTIAPKHLDGTVGDTLRHGSAVKLHAIGIQTIAISGKIQITRNIVDIGTASHVFCIRFSNGLLNLQH